MVLVLKVMCPQSQLLEIIAALHPCAASRAACTAGSNSAIRIPMIVMTTKSSTSVKPPVLRLPISDG